MGVWSSTWRQLPRANGRRWSGGRGRAQIYHGLLGKTLSFWGGTVLHLSVRGGEGGGKDGTGRTKKENESEGG